MGIDIYMRWKGQTEAEKQAQYTGFSTLAGNVGYLREAYHGGPYATKYLVKEAFDESDGAKIQSKVLHDRLPETIKIVADRERKKSSDTSGAIKSFVDFVKLAESKEKETGEPVTVVASW